MMDVHAQLVAVVNEARSLADALVFAIGVIAKGLDAEACTIFVRRPPTNLEVGAHYGAVPDTAVADAAKHLAKQTLVDVRAHIGEAPSDAMVAVPVAALNQAIGAIVVRRSAKSPFTAEEIMRLSGVASQMVDLIENVGLMETLERSTDAPVPGEQPAEPRASMGEKTLRGIPISSGIGMGVVNFRNAFPRVLLDREAPHGDVAAETSRVRDALQKTRNDLVRMQSAAAIEIGEEQALIFGAHLLLLNGSMLTRLVDEGLAAGRPAPIAIDNTFDEIVRRLREARDPYIQERVEDIEDLRCRVLDHLIGSGEGLDGAPDGDGNIDARVVVSVRTSPSLLVELKARGALGVASELGGPTSHGALLARALGVPAVSGIPELTREIFVGDVLIIDGDEGIVVVRPTEQTRAKYAERSQVAERARTEFLRYRDEPATTADGVRFQLQANIALGSDLQVAAENRADGIGLYRTEFPFIVRDALPTVEEQTRIYAKAFDAFPTLPVTFRLLDLGGDKFLPGGGLGVARDAFHGYRSIRVLFDYPHVLRDQVQAFARAAAGKDLRILIPLVTSLEDVIRIKQLVAASLEESPWPYSCTSVSYGAMVETAAAVEIVDELASEVDFFSVGTNDLIQYALVVDREDPRMSSGRNAYHPAILRMINRVVTRAHGKGKSVNVCGEMAARPELAIALLAFGVDGLSVTPRAIPVVKQALARLAVRPLCSEVGELLAISTAEGVEVALRRYVHERESPG